MKTWTNAPISSFQTILSQSLKSLSFIVLVFFSLLSPVSIFAAEEPTQNNPQNPNANDPCFTQKIIWSGYREPVNYLKPQDHKNIFIHGDGTVTDRINKLEWKACPEGQEYVQGSCLGDVQLFTWYEAPNRIKDMLYAGRNDWRVPTVDELETVIDLCTQTGAYFNKDAFPDTEPGIYWTSSHDPGYYNEYVAWYVDFATATSSFLDKERLGRIRAVRTMR